MSIYYFRQFTFLFFIQFKQVVTPSLFNYIYYVLYYIFK